MMFGYADDRARWQAGLMPVAMTTFWGLPIWAIYSLSTCAARRPGPWTPTASNAATTRGASWTSAWPTARPAPVRTSGSAMSFRRR
jgi:hypothetical protein